ncbi:MAG: response regulator [Lentisphaerae bacterium]|nr:response regulator [Lentisphaerota bacterium]
MLESLLITGVAGIALILAALLLVRQLPAGRTEDRATRQRPGSARENVASLQREYDEHRDAQEQLQDQKQWYRTLFRNTRDMVVVYPVTEDGLPGLIAEVNDIICSKLEQSRTKLVGMSPLDIEEPEPAGLTPGYTREELVLLSDKDMRGISMFATQALVRRILDMNRITYERVFVSRSGKRIPVEIEARRVDRGEQIMVMCIARDVGEKKEVERLLRASRERSRDFFSYSPIGVALYDAERSLVNVNRACLKMFASPDAMEFGRFNIFDNPFLPDPIKKRLREGETVRYEAAIDFDEVRRIGLFISGKTGPANFDMLITNLGVDNEFNPKGFLVQVQDVTERRKAETALRHSERQLRQAQKMEAIGTLAGGVAHDFNNILTPILGYTEMCLYSTEESTEVHKYLQEVMKAVNRAKDLVKQILTFSRQMEPEGRPIRVSPIVKEALTLMRATIPPNVDIRRAVKTERDVIQGNPTQIHQVLMNLCINAVHAMEEQGGVLEVLMSDFLLSRAASTEFPQLNPGRYLRISVRDTGCGMDRETMDRIFEPFFTTKHIGRGTGMGLSVVHGIISGLNGGITVESEKGEGTVFHIVLPIMEETLQPVSEEGVVLPSGTETVLFVDDDVDVGRMVARMLETLGYKPVLANRGQEALWIFEKDPRGIDLVITDQAMPEMSGEELAEHLLAARPDVPIIVCTGFGDKLTPRRAKEMGVREFMTKPLVMRELSETIRRVLDAKPAGAVASGSSSRVQ